MSPLADQTDWQIFPDVYLRNFSAQVFMHFGVPKADAEQAADVLAAATCAASTPTAWRGCIPISKCLSWANQSQTDY